MKDIIITSKKVKKELYILLGCFIIAIFINIGSIIYYNTFWKEIITQIGYEIVIALVLYILALIIRGIAFLFARYVFKKSR